MTPNQLRRQSNKRLLISYLGGCCDFCGIKKKLTFHHLLPGEKSFTIGKKFGHNSIDKLLAEADKCILLCSKCHVKVHNIGLLAAYKEAIS